MGRKRKTERAKPLHIMLLIDGNGPVTAGARAARARRRAPLWGRPRRRPCARHTAPSTGPRPRAVQRSPRAGRAPPGAPVRARHAARMAGGSRWSRPRSAPRRRRAAAVGARREARRDGRPAPRRRVGLRRGGAGEDHDGLRGARLADRRVHGRLVEHNKIPRRRGRAHLWRVGGGGRQERPEGRRSIW